MREYHNVFMSSFYLLRIIRLDFNYDAMYLADPTTSAFYLVSYIVYELIFTLFQLIFTIALANMFIAIIVAHFNEFRRIQLEDDDISFVSVVWAILKNNVFTDPDQSKLWWVISKFTCCCNSNRIKNWLFNSKEEKE